MGANNTSLLIDKEIHSMAKIRAKQDSLSVSAAARFLLKAYAEGKISIQANAPSYNNISFQEVKKSDLSLELQQSADEAYLKEEDELVNI